MMYQYVKIVLTLNVNIVEDILKIVNVSEVKMIRRLTFKTDGEDYVLRKSINVLGHNINIGGRYSLKDLQTFRSDGIEVVIK